MLYLRLLGSALAFAGVIEAQVNLGTALSYAVLGGSAVTNTGPSIISGNVGVSPGTSITGIPPGIVVNGVIHMADASAAQAQVDVTTAYNAAAGLAPTADLTGQDLGGMTLVAGVYKFNISAQLTGPLVLDGQGNSGSVWVFQIGSTLTTATASSVILIGGASPCNVFWQVGSSATIGTTTTFVGNVLALTSITLITGASSNGGLYARNGAVTLDTNNVNAGLACPPIQTTTTTTTTTVTTTTTNTDTATTTVTTTTTNTDTATTTTTTTNTDTATTTTTTTATDTATTTVTTTTATATTTTTATDTATTTVTTTTATATTTTTNTDTATTTVTTTYTGKHTYTINTATTSYKANWRTARHTSGNGTDIAVFKTAMFGTTGATKSGQPTKEMVTTIRPSVTTVTFTATCFIAPTTITSYGQKFFIKTPCTTVLTATVSAAFEKPAPCKHCVTLTADDGAHSKSVAFEKPVPCKHCEPPADDGAHTKSSSKLWQTYSHEAVPASQVDDAASKTTAHFQWNEPTLPTPADPISPVIVTAGVSMNWPNLAVVAAAVLFLIAINLL